MKTIYECEVCGFTSNNKEAVEACEAQPVRPAPDVYELASSADGKKEYFWGRDYELRPDLGYKGGTPEGAKVSSSALRSGDAIFRFDRYDWLVRFEFTGIEKRGHNMVIAHKGECQVGKDYDAVETAIYPEVPSEHIQRIISSKG